jgi:hypothetical protein
MTSAIYQGIIIIFPNDTIIDYILYIYYSKRKKKAKKKKKGKFSGLDEVAGEHEKLLEVINAQYKNKPRGPLGLISNHQIVKVSNIMGYPFTSIALHRNQSHFKRILLDDHVGLLVLPSHRARRTIDVFDIEIQDQIREHETHLRVRKVLAQTSARADAELLDGLALVVGEELR